MLTRYFEGRRRRAGEPTDAWPAYKPIIIQVGSTAIICAVGGERREEGEKGQHRPTQTPMTGGKREMYL